MNKGPSKADQRVARVAEYPETHQCGHLSIENMPSISEINGECDLGIHIANDGRIWVCINGIAFIRFKPVNERTGKDHYGR